MKTIIITGIILVVFASVWLYYMSETFVVKPTNHMKVNVGKKCILDKDTLTIVDFNIWNNTYKLSNGVSVDSSFSSHIIK